MKKEKPAYLMLYEALRQEIVREDWPEGARLPSRRQTARDRGVSMVTVEHSYELLCQEGYIESRPRSGYYVIYRSADGFAHPLSRAVSFPETAASVGRPQTFPFSVLARTMRRVLTEYGEAILIKSPGMGCEALRSAISRYLARNRGIRAETDQIVIGSGAEYLYGLVVEMLGADRAFAIEQPSYAKIEQVPRQGHPVRSAAPGTRRHPDRRPARHGGQRAAHHALPQLPQRRHRQRVQASGVHPLGRGTGALHCGGRF